jgi:uncharacterized protein (DUF488 family)
LEEFVGLLKEHGVRTLGDVRSIPKSRRFPYFADTSLAVELPKRGLNYLPFKSLGGRRKTRKDSVNLGWRNESFRGYADYMQTEEFAAGLEELMGEARMRATAIMCAEAVPWRCHRSLISDALLVRGWKVLDIIGKGEAKEHRLKEFAKVEGIEITYPALEDSSGLFAAIEPE